ncbi:MAG TPA: hypothetical protein VLB03_00165 [Nocardioidaceae bacterium]|nr:hypothetical protein [Nocardioidaceae bacterium]
MSTTVVAARELSWPARSGTLAAALMMGWLTLVLWLDREAAGGSIWLQRGLGVFTWVVLGLALRRVTPTVRVQTGVVVAFATLVEYVFSPTLEVYLYRFDNVPMYVPPGHGLVYLSAYALGHTRLVERHLRAAVVAVVAVGGVWAAHGVLVAERSDALGAFWFACLVGFLLWGPSKPVYVGAFLVVSYLEIVGTELRTWVWQTEDPVLGVSIGNPPSGAAGGYGWFDLAGLLLAPYLLGVLSPRRRRGRLPERPQPEAADVH